MKWQQNLDTKWVHQRADEQTDGRTIGFPCLPWELSRKQAIHWQENDESKLAEVSTRLVRGTWFDGRLYPEGLMLIRET